jgi:type I restriction enzyme S subunit
VYGSGGQVGTHDVALHNQRSIIVGRKGSVGSIFVSDGPFWCIDTAYYLDNLSEWVNIDYLASYLKSLDLSRLAISVAVPGLNRQELAAVPVPLPTLLEQQRIVGIMRQAQELRRFKDDAGGLSRQLGSALFEQHFGVVGASSEWKLEPFGKHITYSKYGPRFPDQQYSDAGIHILRTTDMNDDGTIRWSEAPRLALTDQQIAEHALRPGTLLISRSGTIGPFALFDGPEGSCVAGAYLIEFGLADSLDPEYARSLFATQYVQKMLKKAVRSVAQPNINAPNIQAIKLPIPPIEVQRRFSAQIRAFRTWVDDLKGSAATIDELVSNVSVEAFSGRLTARWRDRHAQDLESTTSARDDLFGESGVNLLAPPSKVSGLNDHAPAVAVQTESRQWLLAELSDFQRSVLRAFLGHPRQHLLAEDADVFNSFCESGDVVEHLGAFDPSPNQVRRTLSQLSALGLIAKVTVPKLNTLTGEREYLKAFRPLRNDEDTRFRDVEALRQSLSINIPRPTYTFTVESDREASERVGAGGMFQVISLTDEDEKDRTNLIDVGKHYASLAELANDVAKRLEVSADQIVLTE